MKGIIISVFLWVSVSASPSGHGLSPNKEGESPRTVDQIIKDALPEDSGLPTGFSLDKDNTMLIEMDMKMSRDRYMREYQGVVDEGTPYKGIVEEKLRWTDDIVPYEINSIFNDWQRDAIRAGMDEWEKYTCLKFVPRTNQQNYIHILSGNGCWSYVGMNGGRQELSLGISGCVYHHTIVHEIGHAVGFHHEQTRFDRDDWLTVYEDNIMKGQEHNFEKYKESYVSDFGIKYDYWSVMHYGVYAFSGNGGMTLIPHDERYEQVIGSVPGLSFKDIQLATIMYKCDEHCTNTCPKGSIRSKNCECWCNTGNPGKPVVEWDGVSVCHTGDDFYGETCLDYHDKCEEWANMGECAANPYFMTAQCRKSCGICGENAKCIDYNEHCPHWWLIGECQRNPGWMKMNCRLSCGVCEDGTKPDYGECEDQSDMCAEGAEKNYCEAYASLGYLDRCPASCKSCGPDRICRNWDFLCETWKEMGECDKDPEKMHQVCAKACGVCSGGEDIPDCKNYADDRNCDLWAKAGECASNPFWMLYKCPVSCKVCGDDALCMDRSPSCANWEKYDFCETDPVSMKFACPVSCGLCEDDSGNEGDCKNYDIDCEGHAARGECSNDPAWMLMYCPKQCQVCGPEPVCKDWHTECDEWANKWDPSECDKNPYWMHIQCAESCNQCDDDGNRIPTTTPSNTRPPTECKNFPIEEKYCHDHAKDCAERVARGECTSDVDEMFRFCTESCGYCGDNIQCRDYSEQCGDWVLRGDCEDNPGHMDVTCPKSCGCCT